MLNRARNKNEQKVKHKKMFFGGWVFFPGHHVAFSRVFVHFWVYLQNEKKAIAFK